MRTPGQASSSAASGAPARHKPRRRKVDYESAWIRRQTAPLDPGVLRDSLRLACQWLAGQSMLREACLPPEENPHGYEYACWRGAAREYDARERRWQVLGPLWHTGQAVKALVLAARALGEFRWLEAARRGADFILQAQPRDPADPHDGAMQAWENAVPHIANTSCMLEALDGLMTLGDETGDSKYWEASLAALDWAGRTMFLPEEGLFLDDFDWIGRTARSAPNTLLHQMPGRPLLDDGVYLKAWHKTKRADYRKIFYAVADRLLKEERPAGNWIGFPPCDQKAGILHPRHGFWWGRPMIMAWQESGRADYLECARRVARWYGRAQRLDGGMFRATDTRFNTTSFAQAASGVLAAACLWHDLIVAGRGEEYREPFRRAIRFGQSMQFVRPADPRLEGAILEKVLPPDGTDRLPYRVRDLGAIFYIQALALGLLDGLTQEYGT